MIELFQKGGPIMWPLLLCSLISLTITAERAIFWLRERRRGDRRVVGEAFSAAGEGKFEQAEDLLRGSEDMEARVLARGLAHRRHGLAESMETQAMDEVERMKRGLPILDTIITMAPLLGILGTVLGIIESFDFLGDQNIENPKAVTGGIAEALLTTAFGLSVALLSLVPYNYLVARVQARAARLEKIIANFELVSREGRDCGARARGGAGREGEDLDGGVG